MVAALPRRSWARSLAIVAAALLSIRCESSVTNAHEPESITLRVACTSQPTELECAATTHVDAPASGGRDVTHEAAWTTSDAAVATVNKGRVVSVGHGMAHIHASVGTRAGTAASRVTVLVDHGQPPQIAYALEGELRDPNNMLIEGAAVTLTDFSESTTRVTVPNGLSGSFRFFPVRANRYRLSAEKPGFRANQREVIVPAARPIILVLLPEPTSTAAASIPAMRQAE